jgi:hypothetical protein
LQDQGQPGIHSKILSQKKKNHFCSSKNCSNSSVTVKAKFHTIYGRSVTLLCFAKVLCLDGIPKILKISSTCYYFMSSNVSFSSYLLTFQSRV